MPQQTPSIELPSDAFALPPAAPYVAQSIDEAPVLLQKYGVVVIPDVFSAEECDTWMDQIVSSIERLSRTGPEGEAKRTSTGHRDNRSLAAGHEVTRHNITKTWINRNLPPQRRYGLYQALLNNLEPVWKIRRDRRVFRVFRNVYTALRKRKLQMEGNLAQNNYIEKNAFDSFVSSIDGVNIQPNQVPWAPSTCGKKGREQDDLHLSASNDWAHLDQTDRRDPFQCVQGQVVLTNTTAAFRCTPGSHTKHREILDACHIPSGEGLNKPARNWLKFHGDDQLRNVQDIVRGCAGSLTQECSEKNDAGTTDVQMKNQDSISSWWQVPIRAGRGSMILWLSSTIHSALNSTQKLTPTPSDPWRGWRGVVYVCLRPKCEFSEEEMNVLETCMEMNLGTNHWATKVFRVADVRHRYMEYSPAMKELMENPVRVYEVLGWKPAHRDFEVSWKSECDGCDQKNEEGQAKSQDDATRDTTQESSAENPIKASEPVKNSVVISSETNVDLGLGNAKSTGVEKIKSVRRWGKKRMSGVAESF